LGTLSCSSTCARHAAHLPSFPTRRSSDLMLSSSRSTEECVAMTKAYENGDFLKIQALITDYVWSLDMGDIDRMLTLFADDAVFEDRKSTRLNSSHVKISYAVFCLKKKIHP